MKTNHLYFTKPELFYQTQQTRLNFDNFSLTIEEIQDLDKCIDFQCDYLEKYPLPPPYKGILEDLCPYFAKIWDSALNLSHWIVQHQKVFMHKNVLEIGAGLAIPSMVMAKLGHNITATDYHPHAQYFAATNQRINQLPFSYYQNNWNNLHQLVSGFDVVIASDILYEGKYISDLTDLLKKSLSPNAVFILCDPVRGYLQKFLTELEKDFVIDLETVKFKQDEHFLVTMKWPSDYKN